MVKTTKKAPQKKKGVKKQVKKSVPKKAAPKKKAAKKTIPKKKAAAKKRTGIQPRRAIKRKTVALATVKKQSRKAKAKPITKKITATPVTGIDESQLPPVEEKSPEIINPATMAVPGMDNKSMQRAAALNYDNHSIRLSNKKGGIKPAGKKPLWKG